jgi:3-hydroxyacyl-CoA dehydrogenase
LGRKNGLGFYRYPPGLPHDAPGLDDPEAQAFIGTHIASPRTFTDEEIVHRLLLPTVLEGTRLVEERRLADVRDVDLAMIFGLGFPAARGGLVYWADTLGAARIVELLSPWSHLGELAQPTRSLVEAARRGVGLYELPPGA